MFRRVVVQIQFPKLEYEKLSSMFTNIFSIRYRVSKSFYHLGTVQDAYKRGPEMVVLTLEIRKDETPGWYARSIVESAKREEIFVLKDSEIMCEGGRITKIEGLDECSDNDFVEPFEAWIIPSKKKAKH